MMTRNVPERQDVTQQPHEPMLEVWYPCAVCDGHDEDCACAHSRHPGYVLHLMTLKDAWLDILFEITRGADSREQDDAYYSIVKRSHARWFEIE